MGLADVGSSIGIILLWLMTKKLLSSTDMIYEESQKFVSLQISIQC